MCSGPPKGNISFIFATTATSKSRPDQRDGCYIDMRSPLPKGASVAITIVVARDAFEAEATVAYVDPRLGMGLVFRNLSPGARRVLQKWLWEAEHEPRT